jgi:hypothetical protein
LLDPICEQTVDSFWVDSSRNSAFQGESYENQQIRKTASEMRTKKLSVNWLFATDYNEQTKEHLVNALKPSAEALANNLGEQCRRELEDSKPNSMHISMATVPTNFTQDGEQMHLMSFLCLTRGTRHDVLASCLIKNLVAPIGQITGMKSIFIRDFEELAKKSKANVTIVERHPTDPQL